MVGGVLTDIGLHLEDHVSSYILITIGGFILGSTATSTLAGILAFIYFKLLSRNDTTAYMPLVAPPVSPVWHIAGPSAA